MGQIIIQHKDGTSFPLVSREKVSAITKAEQQQTLLSEDVVNISVTSAKPLDFKLGDTIQVWGKTYTLNQLPALKKTGERRFSYDLTFEGVQYELIDALFILPFSVVNESLTGNIETFANQIIENANRVFPNSWILGDFPEDTEYKTLTFSNENCLQVLQNICEEYNTEFEILQGANQTRALHIRKAGQNFPYTFQYGRTGGLYNLERNSVSSKSVVTRLYSYGGAQNINNYYTKKKASARLCLPNTDKHTSFVEDPDRVANFGLKENSYNFEEIFPNRYGTVSAITGDDKTQFFDSEMFNLKERYADTDADYQYWLAQNGFENNSENHTIFSNDVAGSTKWLIDGTPAKVHFNTGNLAGYEFELHDFIEDAKGFVLKPFKDENGMEFPSPTSAAFQIGIGDKYFLIDINLPQAYIDEAEQKLQEKAEEYYNQNSQPQVEYSLGIDRNFLKQFEGELTIVNLFAVGDYIPVKDNDIGVDKSLRITSFTRDLTQNYAYRLTLGEVVSFDAITRIISEQLKTDKIIDINNLNNPARARQNWRTTQEVLGMTFDPEGNYYSEKISPVAIETLALLAGSKSMQFILNDIKITTNYNDDVNSINVTAGTLTHLTMGGGGSPRTWDIAANTTVLMANKPYYIYAQCQKNSGSYAAGIIYSQDKKNPDYDPDYYYFLIGIVSSIDSELNERIVTLSYGISFINGRFIKTGRIESSGGGDAYFDLDAAEIGGRINFKDGLISGNIALTDIDGTVTAGLEGSLSEDVGLWLGGTFADAQNGNANIVLYKNGTGKIGIFEVSEGTIRVRSSKGIFEYSDESIRLLSLDGAEKVVITSDNLPDISIINNQNSFSIPSFTGSWQKTGFPPVFADIKPLDATITIIQGGNNVSVNISGHITAHRPNSAGSRHYSAYLYFKHSNGYTNAITLVDNKLLEDNGIFSFNVNRAFSMPTGNYGIFALGTWDGSSGVPTSIDLVIDSGSGGSIIYKEQRTVIAKNGIASIWSNTEYFIVEKDGSNALKIRMQGDIFLEGALKNVPVGATTANTGQIYINSSSDNVLRVKQ
ncbi:MAG: phage tail protein [Prevotellaceae bacterium]|jgi:hypothetical protein|nr:phage tail protein [Prevotellaceae bacterium]